MLFSSDRKFRLWDYNVSHDQLLLRSPKSPNVDSNIDIVFWGVEFITLPTSLHGIAILLCFDGDESSVPQLMGKNCGVESDIFCIESGRWRFIVAAAGFKVFRNTLDIFESSLEYFSGTDEKRKLGDILAHS